MKEEREREKVHSIHTYTHREREKERERKYIQYIYTHTESSVLIIRMIRIIEIVNTRQLIFINLSSFTTMIIGV